MPLIFHLMGSPRPKQFKKYRGLRKSWSERLSVWRHAPAELREMQKHHERIPWEQVEAESKKNGKGYAVIGGIGKGLGAGNDFEAHRLAALLKNTKGRMAEAQKAAQIAEARKRLGILTEAVNNLNRRMADINLGHLYSTNLKKGFTWVHLGTVRGFWAALIKGEKTTYVSIASPRARVRIPLLSRVPIVGSLVNTVLNTATYIPRRISAPIREDIERQIVQDERNLNKALSHFEEIKQQITPDDIQQFNENMQTHIFDPMKREAGTTTDGHITRAAA